MLAQLTVMPAPSSTIFDLGTNLVTAITNNDVRGVRELVADGCDVSACDELGWSPLLWAAKSGNHEIVGLLIAAKADLEAQDPSGNTALHKSAQGGSVRCVGMLLEAGADAAHCNFHRQTPLDMATLFGRQDCVQRLSDAGAKTSDCHVQTVRDDQVANGEGRDGEPMPDLKSSRFRQEETDEIAQMGVELNRIQAFVDAAKADKQDEDGDKKEAASEAKGKKEEADEKGETKDSAANNAPDSSKEMTCDFALDFEKRMAQIRESASQLPTKERLAQKHQREREAKIKALEEKRKAAEQEQKAAEEEEEEQEDEEDRQQHILRSENDSAMESMQAELQEARAQIRRLQQSRMSREELVRAVRDGPDPELVDEAEEANAAASQQAEPM
jgi:hypothetical protein